MYVNLRSISACVPCEGVPTKNVSKYQIGILLFFRDFSFNSNSLLLLLFFLNLIFMRVIHCHSIEG